MPWTVGDVEKHKKGLTDAQKAQWVAVANSVLAKCVSNGGSDATCAPSAIRQANGVVGHSMNYAVFNKKQKVNPVRTVQHQGAPHLVVPVSMMVEGVHNGSHGPMFHSIAELGRFPDSWNGMPVVIDHPEINGVNVSANQPEIIEQQKIGSIYNTHVDGARLMAEMWIHEEKLRQLSSTVLAALQAGETLEVSLGVFTEEDETPGTWNGETYETIARNHRPDHLALLPGGVGACSVADGCGTCVNKATCVVNQKGGNNVNELEFNKALKEFYVNQLNSNAEQGYKELVDSARQKIDSMDSENTVHFLQEVYDDFLVYEVRQRVGGTKVYKQEYQYNGGAIELKGTPTEVRKKVEYIALAEGSGRKRTRLINENKEVTIMAENAEKCTPCIKKRVDALIAHESKKFAETDRVWLETFSEEQLDKMIPTVVEKEVTKEVNVLTDAQKAALAYGEKLLKEKRENMIKGIQANATKEVWPDDVLANMEEGMLERVFTSVKKEETPDFSVNGSGNFQKNGSKVRPMAPTGIKFKEVTK